MVCIQKQLLLGLLVSSIIGTPLATSTDTTQSSNDRPTCFDTEISVTIQAKNVNILPGTSLSSYQSILATLVNSIFSTIPLQKTYTIAGTYCQPPASKYNASRANTLQLLAHPATYDRTYWFGGNHTGLDGDNYSWVLYASDRGYATFALDRLGNGLSQHPDGITEVQCAAQASTINEILNMAKTGTGPFPRAFSKTIFIGASMGSLVGNVMLANFPQSVDAAIFTGFSSKWINVIPGFTLTAGLLPTDVVDSPKYGSLGPGYLMATNTTGISYLLFYGPGPNNQYYDPALIQADYAARGTITVGEAVSGALPPSAPQYMGSVYVINGEQDRVFCGHLGLETDPPSNCLTPENFLNETQILYPAAVNYEWDTVPDSGHCWEHQNNAQIGFNKSHDWLQSRGL